MLRRLRNTLGPLFLIFACPPAAILIWYTNTTLRGSLSTLWSEFMENGFFTTLYTIWKPVFFGSTVAWQILFWFALTQLLFMRFLPGKSFLGPLTPKGNYPAYKANGVLSFFLTLLLFWLASSVFKLFTPTIVYDNFGPLLGALNLLSLVFCLFLYFKGRFFPSSSDSGITGNFVFDYYWGTELYPRIFGWDVKMFTNCRFGLMGWGVILLSYVAKQEELYGLSDALLISVLLQLFYITKFFFWERGYLCSLDIMHDRAGFYICWGCLVWVPCVYTSPAMYLVQHPIYLGPALSLLFFGGGTLCILANYLADRQRFRFRASNGECMIWGKPAEITHARYKTILGEEKASLLLASGWWGIARHFHYVPEILGALFWTLPALFTNFLPYFYVIFLSFLLFDRAIRDDNRCATKYGEDWKTHCKKVPYKILPYIY